MDAREHDHAAALATEAADAQRQNVADFAAEAAAEKGSTAAEIDAEANVGLDSLAMAPSFDALAALHLAAAAWIERADELGRDNELRDALKAQGIADSFAALAEAARRYCEQGEFFHCNRQGALDHAAGLD